MIKTSIGFVTCCLLIVLYYPLSAQISDPVGDASPASVDYIEHYFEQQGESLYVSITMNDVIANRIKGYSTHTFFTDSDFDVATGQPGSRVGSENNITFTDIGTGVWFMRMWVLWDHDPAYNSFAHRALGPVKISEDGKTMSYKFSLVGLNWEELQYDLNGWYKDGTYWHQVPHLPGDIITDAGLYSVDNASVTQLVSKVGTKCMIDVPEPYSSTADAKNITGIVDEMVDTVQSNIGAISDPSKKYTISYEMFEDYAKPYPYFSSRPNLYMTRIPGSGWIDEPDWMAMLLGLENMTLAELNAGAREVLLTQHSYHRPIPGSGEGWYSTNEDSINGFLWDAFHKYSFKALLGRAFENCLTFHLAELMSESDAKTAILVKMSEAENAWSGFSGDAFDLTPEIMTGFLLAQNSDLAWTEKVYKEILPHTVDTEDTTNGFTKILNNYINHSDYRISSSDDFLTQAHHGWYATIASVQAAILNLAMDSDIFTALQSITNFPLDKSVYDEVKILLGRKADQIYTFTDAIPYVWNDIKSMGTALLREQFSASWGSPDTDDGSAGPIYMGMSFKFYDQTFDSIYIGVNGQCSFTDPIDWITTAGYGMTIPGMGWDNILCPLAADLMIAEAYPNAPYHTATGTIYYYHDVAANSFTIEYYHITNHHYVINEMVIDTTITFQVVLDADDNSITYYYKDLGIADEPVAKRTTIGIQPSKDGDLGVQYYGGNIPENGYPVNETAIKFYPRTSTDIEPKYSEQVVSTYELFQNYPNPFNPTTTIGFELKNPDYVKITIYNIIGEEVKTIIDGKMQQGFHEVLWDGTDNSKNNSASGVYIYTLKTNNFTKSKKMVLIK